MGKFKLLRITGTLFAILLVGSLMAAPAFAKVKKPGDNVLICHYQSFDDPGPDGVLVNDDHMNNDLHEEPADDHDGTLHEGHDGTMHAVDNGDVTGWYFKTPNVHGYMNGHMKNASPGGSHFDDVGDPNRGDFAISNPLDTDASEITDDLNEVSDCEGLGAASLD